MPPSFFSSELADLLFSDVAITDHISQSMFIIERRWKLALLLGSLHIYGLSGKPLKKASGMSIVIERRAVEAGALTLAGGEGRILQLLDRIRVTAPPSVAVQLISEAFPGLLTKLRHGLGPLEQERLLTVIRVYIGNSTSQDVAVVWREGSGARSGNVQHSATALGIRKERVRLLLKQQGVSPKVRISSAGRSMLVVGDEDLRRVETALLSALAKREVGNAYGISPARQDELIKLGLLKAVGRKIDGASIDQLFKKLHQICQAFARDPEGKSLISLSEALRCMVPRQETAVFFEALISNRLKLMRMQGEGRMADRMYAVI